MNAETLTATKTHPLKQLYLIMISNIRELQDLITWAKSHKLKRLKLADIEFEFSELAHVESYPDVDATPGLDKPAESAKLPNNNAEIPEDEQLLYWSTR